MTTLKEYKAMMEGATDAPWPYEYTGDGKHIIVGEGLIDGPNGYDVAEFYSDDCQAESNAQFVSASRELAPELIRVIELAESALNMAKDFKTNDIVRPKLLEALSEIRKLKGE